MAAAYDHRVDAIAPQITWYDLADSFFPDATGKGARNGVFKKTWAGLFFTSGSSSSTACGRFLPSLCAIYQKVAETGHPTADAITTLRESSPSSVAGRIHVPTLLVQGQADSLFPLDQADANARAITGAPVKVVWFQGGHDGGDPETSRVNGLVDGWFDRYLKGGPPVDGGFTVTRSGGIDSSTQRITVTAASAGPLPRPDRHHAPYGPAERRRADRPQPGGRLPRRDHRPCPVWALSAAWAASPAARVGLDLPGQSATFDSEPLNAPLQLTGTPRVRVRVRGATAEGARPRCSPSSTTSARTGRPSRPGASPLPCT